MLLIYRKDCHSTWEYESEYLLLHSLLRTPSVYILRSNFGTRFLLIPVFHSFSYHCGTTTSSTRPGCRTMSLKRCSCLGQPSESTKATPFSWSIQRSCLVLSNPTWGGGVMPSPLFSLFTSTLILPSTYHYQLKSPFKIRTLLCLSQACTTTLHTASVVTARRQLQCCPSLLLASWPRPCISLHPCILHQPPLYQHRSFRLCHGRQIRATLVSAFPTPRKSSTPMHSAIPSKSRLSKPPGTMPLLMLTPWLPGMPMILIKQLWICIWAMTAGGQ